MGVVIIGTYSVNMRLQAREKEDMNDGIDGTTERVQIAFPLMPHGLCTMTIDHLFLEVECEAPTMMDWR